MLWVPVLLGSLACSIGGIGNWDIRYSLLCVCGGGGGGVEWGQRECGVFIAKVKMMKVTVYNSVLSETLYHSVCDAYQRFVCVCVCVCVCLSCVG